MSIRQCFGNSSMHQAINSCFDALLFFLDKGDKLICDVIIRREKDLIIYDGFCLFREKRERRKEAKTEKQAAADISEHRNLQKPNIDNMLNESMQLFLRWCNM